MLLEPSLNFLGGRTRVKASHTRDVARICPLENLARSNVRIDFKQVKPPPQMAHDTWFFSEWALSAGGFGKISFHGDVELVLRELWKSWVSLRNFVT